MVLLRLPRSYKNQFLHLTHPKSSVHRIVLSHAKQFVLLFRLVLNTYTAHTSVITQRCCQVFKSLWASCNEVGIIYPPVVGIWLTELPNSAHPLTTSLSHHRGIKYRSSYFGLIDILKRFMSGNILLWPSVIVLEETLSCVMSN